MRAETPAPAPGPRAGAQLRDACCLCVCACACLCVSCYFIQSPGGFLDIPPLTYVAPDGSAGDLCVSCDFLSTLTADKHPNWIAGLVDPMANGLCPDCAIANATGLARTWQNQVTSGDDTTTN